MSRVCLTYSLCVTAAGIVSLWLLQVDKIPAVTPPLAIDEDLRLSLGLPSCGNVKQKQSPDCSPVLIANDAVVNRKPENFLFKVS